MSRLPNLLQRRRGDATPLEMFDATAIALGDHPLVLGPRGALSATEVSKLVDGLAGALAASGVAAGDRVALHLQNDPQFVVGLLAAWRLGATAVPCSPMLRERELAAQLRDAAPATLIELDELYQDVGAAVAAAAGVRTVITTGRDELYDPVPTATATTAPAGSAGRPLREIAERSDSATPSAYPAPDDIAVLTYTSGTTGPPKGAMNTHANIAQASRIYRDCLEIGRDDVILGIAPLYHVTGLTAHIGLSLATGAPLILAHRFDPAETCRLIERYRATVTVAAITAYVAIANHEAARVHDLSSLRLAYSGGAPIAPATVRDIRARTGLRIRPVYGLTETTGPCHLCPRESDPPIDADSGAMAVGLPTPETQARIVGEHGRSLPPGEVGEVAIRGAQVVGGYWRRPEETAHALPDGELLTGDVGLIDEDGWLYLVDRRKDLIIASGFKVWPREVEDVLYEHPAVREAAVVGAADSYRGETVWAYVSLKPGSEASEDELIAHCRDRLAAYKYPRAVRILAELPKTHSGKILRRDLRSLAETS
jgi:long-chain acyl-CoA synthetase